MIDGTNRNVKKEKSASFKFGTFGAPHSSCAKWFGSPWKSGYEEAPGLVTVESAVSVFETYNGCYEFLILINYFIFFLFSMIPITTTMLEGNFSTLK